MTVIDSRQWPDRGGFQIRALLEPDYDTLLSDIEGYEDDPEVVESYRKEHWNFVILVVEAWREGVLLGRHSISGVVHGIFPNEPDVFIDELDHPDRWTDIADEAVAEAELKLQALCATLKLQATNERAA